MLETSYYSSHYSTANKQQTLDPSKRTETRFLRVIPGSSVGKNEP